MDKVVLIYNEFRSVISQRVVAEQLLPIPRVEIDTAAPAQTTAPVGDSQVEYLYEPEPQRIFDQLLPRFVEVQVYRALLENAASEQGARMSAMDSATRNAGDMIKRLTLNYNRTRQAMITKELIEIISGAEAV